MNCLSVCLLIYEYNHVESVNNLRDKLEANFKVVHATSMPQLRDVVHSQPLFCVVITGRIDENHDVENIRTICATVHHMPVFFFGRVYDKHLSCRLGQAGIDDVFENLRVDALVKKLTVLRESSNFQLDLQDFNIDLHACGCWAKRYLGHITQGCNFTTYRRVRDVANRLGISVVHLNRELKKNGLSPARRHLLCFKLHYAAYLLTVYRNSSGEKIASRCGFANQYSLFRKFKKATGLTVAQFRKKYTWHDFPGLYLQQQNYEKP